MPGFVAVNNAVLGCTQCSKLSVLHVSGPSLIPMVGFLPVATVNDHQSGRNILAFEDVCSTTGKPCAPSTPTPWAPGEGAHMLVGDVPIITEGAMTPCSTGLGIIVVLQAGQSQFQIEDRTSDEQQCSMFDEKYLNLKDRPRLTSLLPGELEDMALREARMRMLWPDLANYYYGPEDSMDALEGDVAQKIREEKAALDELKIIIGSVENIKKAGENWARQRREAQQRLNEARQARILAEMRIRSISTSQARRSRGRRR